MKKILAAMALVWLWGAATYAQNNSCVATSTTNCTAASGDAFSIVCTNDLDWPLACFGQQIIVTAVPTTGLAGLAEVVQTHEDCSVTTQILPLDSSAIIQSSWAATNADQTLIASGSGLTAVFSPTVCGTGKVTFYLTYSNAASCDPGTTTVSFDTNFVAVAVASLAPTNGSACGVTLLSSNSTLQTFQVPVATTGPTHLVIMASACPTLPVNQYPTCWSLNGLVTNQVSIDIEQPASFTIICSAGASAITNIFNVITIAPPSITSQPASQTVLAGTNVGFSVVAGGTPPLGYQWTFNGASIAGATGSVYAISNVQTNNAGIYAVTVTNSLGSITSAQASLTVYVPVAITQPQPVSQTVIQGSNATFSLSATGSALINYQWYFNGTSRIPGATSNVYTKLVVVPADAGNYNTQVSNSVGSITSSNASLTVIVPPIFTQQPTNLTVNLNSSASFNVAVSTNSAQPVSYQWLWNGSVLAGATNNSLTISNVYTTNVGYYSIIVSNAAGTNLSAAASLTATMFSPTYTNASGMSVNYNAKFTNTTLDGRVLELTPPLTDQRGSAFFTAPVNLVSNASFSTYFSFRLSDGGGATDVDGVTGADGIVFVVQTLTNSVGGEGGGIGYVGITNSVGVEFDTWWNNGSNSDFYTLPTKDPMLPDGSTGDGNHIGIDYNGFLVNSNGVIVTNNTQGPYSHITPAMNNGNIWYAWIDYVNTNLEVRLATNNTRPVLPTLTNTVNLLSYLHTNAAYLGFTAGTGGSYNRQDILTWQFISPYHPIGISNAVPSVAITSPSNNAVFLYGPPIALQATASEPGGTITNVQFLAGTMSGTNLVFTNFLGTAVVSANNTYDLDWTNSIHGTNALVAVATDSSGISSTSSVIYVIMDNVPAISAGTNQSLIWVEGSTNASLSLAGSVSDDGLPYGVTNLIWSVVSGPGTVAFGHTNLAATTATFSTNGTYLLQLQGDDGFATNRGFCSVTIGRKPSISITSPTNNNIFSLGQRIYVSATAYDLGGVITNVQFLDGTNVLQTFPSESSLYGMVWTNAVDGIHPLTAVATDNAGLSVTSAVVTITVNTAPVVSAGPNQIITLPVTNTTLAGYVTDDGMPAGAPLTATWSVVSSNGPVTFTNVNVTNTTVSFVNNGVYVLSLSANDTVSTNSATVSITVNKRPQVSAGANQLLTLTQSSIVGSLNGTVFDDGLPVGAAVHQIWSVVSSNGTVRFQNSSLAQTAVLFTNSGVYVLQLTANDTVSTNSANVTITVNRAPVCAVSNQTLLWVEGSTNISTTLVGYVTDDGYPSGILTNLWTEQSGAGTVTFSNATATNSTVAFSTNGYYQLMLTAGDGATTTSAFCTIVILRAPFISITNPTNNAVFPYGITITNTANASDQYGWVTNVQFYGVTGGVTNLLGTAPLVSTATYTMAWTNAPVGTNVLYAVATDNWGLVGTSAPVTITITSPTTVQILSPTNQTFYARTNIPVTALATSSIPGVVISQVAFYWGTNTAITNFIGGSANSTNGIFEADWACMFAGKYVLMAVATDSRGSNFWSAPVTNTALSLPLVSITSPTNGTLFLGSPTNITITGSASADPTTSISNVIFYAGNTVVGTATAGTGGVYSVIWTGATNGNYALKAKATDGNGGFSFSTSIAITIATNQPPNVSAGSNLVINLSSNAVQLNGAASDDGLPYGILTVNWTCLTTNNLTFTSSNQPVTGVYFTTTGTYQFRLAASDGQYTVYSTNTVTVLQPNLPPTVVAGSNQLLILPALANTNPITTVKLQPIAGVYFGSPKGLDYYVPSNCIVVSDMNQATNLILVLSDGTQVPFFTIPNVAADEVYLASVRDTLGGFRIGTLFCGTGKPGEIMRIEPEGTNTGTLGTNGNAWVVLTNASGEEQGNLRGGLWVDRTGVWGGDLIVSTDIGNVWRINSNGVPTMVASNLIGDTFEGITTIPNDPVKYGPWAGKILVGNDHSFQPINAIDTNGMVISYNLGIGAEDIRVIPDNENLFGIGDGNALTSVAASEFQGMQGDILVVAEFEGNFYRVHWDGTRFQIYTIAHSGLWEAVNFAPAGINNVVPVNYVTMHGAVTDDGHLITPTSNMWVQVSGPAAMTFDQPTLTNTLARFTVPGAYYLQLLAFDGQFTTNAQTRVDVIRNQAPVISAGTNFSTASFTNIPLNGSVSDDGYPYGVTNCYWSVISPLYQSISFGDSNQPLTTLNVPQAGTYILRLTADDGQATNSAEVTVTVGTTNISLTPTYGWPTLPSTPYTLTAIVVDPNNNPIVGQAVEFAVTSNYFSNRSYQGEQWVDHQQTLITNYIVLTDVNGKAVLNNTQPNIQEDTITATLVDQNTNQILGPDNQPIQATAIKDWAGELDCGMVSNAYACLYPSQSWPVDGSGNPHYANYYLISLIAGTPLVLYYTNLSDTELILRDPAHQVVSVCVDGTMTYVPTNSGQYLIEMADTTPGPVNMSYILKLGCSTTNYAAIPGITVNDYSLAYPNLLTNGQTIPFDNLSSTGRPEYHSIRVANPGTTNLVISNIVMTGDFSISDDPNSIISPTNLVIAPEDSAYLYLYYNASSNGLALGTMTIDHNAPGLSNVYHLQGGVYTPSIEVDTNSVYTNTDGATYTNYYTNWWSVGNSNTVVFPQATVGNVITQWFQIVNNGSSDLIISNVLVFGSFTNLSGTNFDLPPYTSTNILIAFTAPSNGLYAGEMVIQHNAAGEYYYVFLDAAACPAGTPPQVTLTNLNPDEGINLYRYGPTNVDLEADASANTRSVQFYNLTSNGPVLLGITTNTDTGSTQDYIADLTWSNVPPGIYTLTALAIDAYGRAGQAAPVNVQVIADRLPSTPDGYMTVAGNSSNNVFYPDSRYFSDPDGDPVTLFSVSTPYYGSAFLTNNGYAVGISYTPPWNTIGTDRFTYTVADGHGGLGFATVYVTIIDPMTVVGQPGIAAICNGTNVPNSSTLVFPATQSNAPTSLSVEITNTGTVDLVISGIAILGDFTNLTGTTFDIPPAGATNLNLKFNASSNEICNGEMVISNNSPGQYFVLYLSGSALTAGSPPSVQLNSPANGSTYYAPASFVVSASASSTTTNISYVDFIQITTNGSTYRGHGTVTSGAYMLNLANLPNGDFTFQARAVDSIGYSTTSSPVTVHVLPSNGNRPPVASSDKFTVFANSYNNILNVLANDSDPDGNTLRLIAVTRPSNGGTATVVNGGNAVSYTPAHGFSSTDTSTGTLYPGDGFDYEISDGHGGTAWATVTVSIFATAIPTVTIVQPANGYSTSAGDVVPIVAQVTPYQFITNVQFFLGETLIGSTTNGSNGFFTNVWTANYKDCNCAFTATAYDAFGQIGTSLGIHITVSQPMNSPGGTSSIGPVAAFSTYAAGTNAPVPFTNQVVIRDGILALSGQAYHPLGSNDVAWQLGIYSADGTTLIRDLTPQPYTNSDYYAGTIGSNTSNGVIPSSVDLTTLVNGVYTMRLIVTGGLMITNTDVQFVLNSNLKIGQFSFSQQDLVIPVNGIPLSVTRTYNSLNPDKGDFGYSWTYALGDMDVQIDETRENDMGWNDDTESYQEFSQRINGGRDVTLTLPNGQRTTFMYTPTHPDGYSEVPAWTAAPGVTATLTTQYDCRFDRFYQVWVDNSPYASDDYNVAYGNFDIPGFILKTLDGTQYIINRQDLGGYEMDVGTGYTLHAFGKPYLSQIIERTGDIITIDQSGVTYSSPSGVTNRILFQRNNDGLITTISDPMAIGSSGPPAVKYEYDGYDNLMYVERLVDRNMGTYVTNSFLYLNPNFPHYITEIINANGVPTVRNLYDNSGKLIGIINATGKTNSIAHDLNAQTETTYDAMGNPTIFTYDSRGNVTNILDALGRQTSKTFDDRGNVTSLTDALHHTSYYSFDTNGNQTSVVDVLGHTNLTAYNTAGQPTAHTNALGFVTQIQYDSLGNQTNVVDALSNNYARIYDQYSRPTSVTDSANRTITSGAYNAMGYIASVSNAASGVTTTFDYDANGNLTNNGYLWVNPTNSSDMRNVSTQTTYDARGLVIGSTDVQGNPTSIGYDSSGAQNQIINAYGKVTSWLSDASGNLIQVSHSDGTIVNTVYDDAGRVNVRDESHLPGAVVNGTRMTYNSVGQVMMTERLTNVVIIITTDSFGAPISVVNSIGGVLATNSFGYDDGGRQIAETNGFGNVTRYEYDALGNQTAMIDALGNRNDSVYDPAGHLVATTNSLGYTTQYVYDALGRLNQTIYPDGSSNSLGYSATGQLLFETNRAGLVTAYGYDGADRMTNITKPAVFDPDSNSNIQPTWHFAYDGNGLIKAVSDPKNHSSQFTYDELGRITSHALPLGQTAYQFYDDVGRLQKKTDFKGQSAEYIYDSLGRLWTNQYYTLGSTTATGAIAYTYDAFDNPKTVVEPLGTNVLQYGSQEETTQISTPFGVVHYEYEAVEGRRVRTYTTNSDLRYEYDELGRLKTVTVVMRSGVNLAVPEVTTNCYTKLGSLSDVYYPNGIHAVYLYNVMNILTNLTYSSGATLIAEYSYVANTNDQWTMSTEVQRQDGATYVTNQLKWDYDNLGRLVSETCGSTFTALNYTNGYVYDLAGNRIWTTNVSNEGITVVGRIYNENNQLMSDVTRVNGSPGDIFTNLYDTNGSLTNRSSASEQNSYAYNLQGRLVTTTFNRLDSGRQLAETINYGYDYKGNRVQAQWVRSIDGGANLSGTNVFVYDPNSPTGLSQVMEELPANGASPSVSYTLGSRVTSQASAGVISYLLTDGHGSTRLVTDVNGGVIAQYNYDAYGRPVNFAPSVSNPSVTKVLYTGAEFDADLQQYNLRARYYNPAVGLFNQMDPFSHNQQRGVNLYAYGANDPVNHSDPTGLYEIDVHQYLSAYLAEAVGFTHSEARMIGLEAQGPDSPGDPRDAQNGPWYTGGMVNWENMRQFHFVSFIRLLEMELKVIDDYSAHKLQGHNRANYTSFGEYIHADEDTFAHSSAAGGRDFNYYGDWGFMDNGGWVGHMCQGHRNDHTWTDPDKGMYMAEQLYLDMQFAPVGRTRTPWSKISKTIRDFIEYKPNVYWQSRGIFRVENVTFDGYTKKTQILNTPFGMTDPISAAYKDDYSDVVGFLPTTNPGLQLKPGVAIGVGIVVGIAFSPIGL